MPTAIAYTFTILGVLLVYAELVRPGAILPGSLGVLLVCWGAHALWQHSPQPRGVALCVFGIALFLAEARYKTHVIAGALGTVMLGIGSRLLFRDPLPFLLASAGALLIGIPSTLLARLNRRARQNKTVDLLI